MQLNMGNQMVEIDGMLVAADALSIAERIKEYDPNLEVLCLDPARAESITEEPFIIAEHCKDGVLRPIFRCWELNELVLERIKLSDGQRTSALQTIEDFEANQKKIANQRYRDLQAESADVVHHVLANRKSKYTVTDSRTGELITFFDDRPSTRT